MKTNTILGVISVFYLATPWVSEASEYKTICHAPVARVEIRNDTVPDSVPDNDFVPDVFRTTKTHDLFVIWTIKVDPEDTIYTAHCYQNMTTKISTNVAIPVQYKRCKLEKWTFSCK